MKASGFLVACVASVSNRVIARKLEREGSRLNFSRRTRAETLATQASFLDAFLLIIMVVFIAKLGAQAQALLYSLLLMLAAWQFSL